MDQRPMAYLLARAERCRRQARTTRSPEIAAALRELARNFEAQAVLQAARDDALARRRPH